MTFELDLTAVFAGALVVVLVGALVVGAASAVTLPPEAWLFWALAVATVTATTVTAMLNQQKICFTAYVFVFIRFLVWLNLPYLVAAGARGSFFRYPDAMPNSQLKIRSEISPTENEIRTRIGCLVRPSKSSM